MPAPSGSPLPLIFLLTHTSIETRLRRENLNIFLNQLKARQIKLVNIGAEDLVEGNQKLVLGLTWTLILRYEIHKFGAVEKDVNIGGPLNSVAWSP